MTLTELAYQLRPVEVAVTTYRREVSEALDLLLRAVRYEAATLASESATGLDRQLAEMEAERAETEFRAYLK